MAELPVVLVTFVSPDRTEPPIAKATVNGCVWHRATGEAEDAFRRHVASGLEGVAGGSGAKVVFLV